MTQEAYIILYNLRHTDFIVSQHYCAANSLEDVDNFLDELKAGGMLDHYQVYKVEEKVNL